MIATRAQPGVEDLDRFGVDPPCLLEELAEVQLIGYERRCLTWVAAWETHMVATITALMRRSYASGVEAGRERNGNDADREQVS